MTYQRIQQGNDTFWFDPVFFDDVTAAHFSAAYWHAQQAVEGSSRGRNVAWFVRHQHHAMVLRHYYRGGLIGKILGDQFLWQAEANSRAMQEFTLLQWMVSQGLPVPKPCAARYQRRGLYYCADLIIERIPASQDVATVLQHQPLSAEQWQAVGQAIARLHQAGVYHSDLNCHNILMDQSNKIWLIDFDKCERRAEGRWHIDNLARLRRSLRKEWQKAASSASTSDAAASPMLTHFYWQESDWLALLAGYQQQCPNVVLPAELTQLPPRVSASS